MSAICSLKIGNFVISLAALQVVILTISMQPVANISSKWWYFRFMDHWGISKRNNHQSKGADHLLTKNPVHTIKKLPQRAHLRIPWNRRELDSDDVMKYFHVTSHLWGESPDYPHKVPVTRSCDVFFDHYNVVIMSAVASQITSLAIVYSTICSGADQRKHESYTAFVRGVHQWPVNSPHKGPATRKMFPFDDVIM